MHALSVFKCVQRILQDFRAVFVFEGADEI